MSQRSCTRLRGSLCSEAVFSASVAPVDTGKEPVPKDIFGDAPSLTTRLRQAPATATLLALCVVGFGLTFADILRQAPDPLGTALDSLWSLSLTEGTESFRRFGALELSRIWLDGEWWRLVTTGFLHGSILHLVLNGIALLSIGEWIELAWGRRVAVALFLLASVGGCLASLAWCESPVVVGASAGVLGQAGALWIARRFGDPALREKLAPISTRGLGIVIALCLGMGLFIPGIAQAGHLGGLATGTLVGLAFTLRRTSLRLLAATAVAALLATLTWLGAAPTHRANYYGILGFRLLEDGRPADALILFKQGLERAPKNAAFQNAIAYQLALDGVALDEAEQLAQLALERDPLNPSYLDTLAWIWCRQGWTHAGTQTLHAASWLSESDFPELTEHLSTCASSAVPPPQ